MKSEVKIGKDLPSDGMFSRAFSDLKEYDYDTNEMETKTEIKINKLDDNLENNNNNKIQNNLQYDNFQEIEIENVDLEKGKEKEKEKIIKIGSSQILPSKQKKSSSIG